MRNEIEIVKIAVRTFALGLALHLGMSSAHGAESHVPVFDVRVTLEPASLSVAQFSDSEAALHMVGGRFVAAYGGVSVWSLPPGKLAQAEGFPGVFPHPEVRSCASRQVAAAGRRPPPDGRSIARLSCIQATNVAFQSPVSLTGRGCRYRF